MRKVYTLLVFAFTVIFSYSIIAQQMRTLRGNSQLRFPKKIQKLTLNPLSPGNYSIGTSGDFSTISSAFDKLSSDGIAGPVTFELIDTFYNVPTNYYLNGPIPGAGLNSRVTLQPAANKNVTIQGNGDAVLIFINTSYLTIDGIGLNGTTTLTIHALTNSQFYSNSSVFFLDNSDHNIVQNITAITEDITRNCQVIGFWINNPQNGAGPDSNLIYHNFIKNSGGMGIYISGKNEMTQAGVIRAKCNVIRGNLIGSETDGGITYGIFTQYAESTVIENNVIQNIRRNFIADWVNVVCGINCYWSDNSIIRSNIAHNVSNSTSYGSAGILLMGETSKLGNNNIVHNNMIYDICNSSGQSSSSAAGIEMWNQNNPKVYYNSIYLSDSESSLSGSSALKIDNQCTGIEVVNNIFVNTRAESPYWATSVYSYTTSNIVWDNNDLYSEGNQSSCLVSIGSTKYNTLAEWQAMGKDLNSINEFPHFIDGNLHIDKSVPTNLESHGIPIVGIDVDFDGDARSADLPDIGADEFDGTAIVGVKDKSNQPSSFALLQNYLNPFNPSTKINFSIPKSSFVNLKVYDILGREVATLINEEKPAGGYQVDFDASQFSSGIYFYKITAYNYTKVRKMLLLK